MRGWTLLMVAAAWLEGGIGAGCQSSGDGRPDSSWDVQPDWTPEVPPAPGEQVRSALTFDDAPGIDDATVRSLAAGQLALAAELLAGDATRPNQALSPLSISTALAMTSAGARNDTLVQMEAGLHFPPQEVLHPATNALLLALRARSVPATAENEGVQLQLVNQIFQERTFSPLPAFLDTLGLRYDAGVVLVDFAGNPDGSRVAINDWILAQTNDRIEELLPPGSIESTTALVLANTLYLHAAWASAFGTSATSDGSFHAPEADVTTPFMSGNIPHTRYARVGEVDLIELPFAGYALAFTVIVPRGGVPVDLPALAPELDALPETAIQLSLPRFRVAMPLDLVPALEALGVTDLFDDVACDLTGIHPTAGLFVTGAFHQTFIDVNEGGVEATAATAVVIGDTSAVPMVRVDEPFYFLVRDLATGAPLFVGLIRDPSVVP